MTAGKTRLGPLHIALCAAILAGVSWAAPPVSTLQQPDRLAIWPQGAGSPAFKLVDTEGVIDGAIIDFGPVKSTWLRDSEGNILALNELTPTGAS